MLQAHVGALESRLRKLEIEFGQMVKARGDDLRAQRVAQELGFGVEVLHSLQRGRRKERQLLAAELKKKGWSSERVARVLNCSSRTVQRNFSQ